MVELSQQAITRARATRRESKALRARSARLRFDSHSLYAQVRAERRRTDEARLGTWPLWRPPADDLRRVLVPLS